MGSPEKALGSGGGPLDLSCRLALGEPAAQGDRTQGRRPRSLACLDRVPAAAATFLGRPYGGGPWRREDSAAGGGVGAGTGPPPRGLSNLSAHGDPGGPEGQPGETEAPKGPRALRLSFFAQGASPGAPFVPGPPASQPELVRARRRAVPSGSSPGLGRERTYRRGGGQSAGPAGMNPAGAASLPGASITSTEPCTRLQELPRPPPLMKPKAAVAAALSSAPSPSAFGPR
ncbi:LIM domain-containing protein 2 isoform X1 [Lynx rufus]|uniref:LIM domain-containing protein 2 isoform X1 n=1 Tax=Lynx rufus TaxID=61384 RepID=UPI001F1275F6|nr:LIM domain-containing protein 2 isoform X1 [Lynx rufus]